MRQASVIIWAITGCTKVKAKVDRWPENWIKKKHPYMTQNNNQLKKICFMVQGLKRWWTPSDLFPLCALPFPGRGVVALNGCVGSRRGGDIYPTKVPTYPRKSTIPTIFLVFFLNTGVTFQSAKVSTSSEWNEMNPNSVVLHTAPPTAKENWNILTWFPKACPFALCVNNPPAKPFCIGCL